MKRADGCNAELLNELCKGKSNKDTASEMEGVSESLLARLRRNDYPYAVKEEHRKSICECFRVSENELFPFVGANGKAS